MRRPFSAYFFMSLFMFFSSLSQQSLAKVYINVSVDWEGREISERNIKAIEIFRKNHPHIPMLHFLNAAYFTKKNSDAEKIKNKMHRVLNKDDEYGLHIHSWKTLVTRAGVEYRSTPTWSRWGDSGDCSRDCGHGVPLWAYTEKELRKVIRFSLDTLENQGFGRAISFRSGGWMSSKKVLTALAREGLTMDASAVPRGFLESSQPVITSWVDKIWGRIKTTSQPYEVETVGGKILEFPNNGCLSDYMTGKMMLSVFKDNVEVWQKDQDKNIFVSIGFHQETAERYLPQLERAIELIEKYSKKYKVSMAYTVNPLRHL